MDNKFKYSKPWCAYPECDHIPNETTRAAIEEARSGKLIDVIDVPKLDLSSPEAMLRSMGIDPETGEDIED